MKTRLRVACIRWKRTALLVVGLVVLVAGGVMLGRFLLEKLERRQSRQLAAQAARDLLEGRVHEARMALETATRLDSKNTRALRLLAPVLEAGGEGSEALGAMARLAESGGMTGHDLLAYTAMALRQGEFEIARRLADVSSTGTDPALRHLLLARVAIATDKPTEAERELRAAVEEDQSGRARLELARFLISRGLNVETRPEALELLRGMSVRPDPMGVEALFIGLTGGAVPLVEMDVWIDALRAHPAATARHLQVADIAEAHLHPGKKSEVARSASRRLRGQSLAVRLEAMDWLLGLDEPKTALELLAAAEVAKEPRVFAVWLNALAQSGDWSSARARLDEGNEPAPEYLTRLFEGREFLEQGDPQRAREAWEEALCEAREDRESFLCALVFLGAFGEPDLFESGLRQALADNPGHPEAVIAAVLPGVSLRRDAGALLRVFEIAASGTAEPSSPLLQNEIDHLALLAGRPVDAEAVSLRSEKHPENFAYRATYALTLLRDGYAEEAMQVLQECKPDVHVASLPRRQKAVVVAVFAANGLEKEARFYAASMPPTSLFEQEVSLLDGHLQQKPASARRVPDSTARARPKSKPVEDLPPLPEGTPDPTERAIAEALAGIDPAAPVPVDATQKILLEAKREAEAAAATGDVKE